MKIHKLLKNSRGFTLIELIMVTVILGIVISVTVPNFYGYLNERRLETAALQMASDIRYLQQRALAEESASYGIAFYPRQGKYNLYKSIKILKSVKLPPGVDVDRTSFRENRLQINVKGLPRGCVGGSVCLVSKNIPKVKYVVVASITGRVRTSDIKPERTGGCVQ
ncbi:prepilin-type N-terminal cleavage/methylation domain-containing protein [Desulfohalotomaculum tongense]|uniref:prepilin-type N-terminal cleavage/methylation domain-containing protein n=1 Tax=Desulforadius tongensis TaxID=1216062 RepID=UPI001959A789|nr:prepilin-type N-terminal cleavage/methylation domain-containing protein [Desulforadius tongensis]